MLWVMVRAACASVRARCDHHILPGQLGLPLNDRERAIIAHECADDNGAVDLTRVSGFFSVRGVHGPLLFHSFTRSLPPESIRAHPRRSVGVAEARACSIATTGVVALLMLARVGFFVLRLMLFVRRPNWILSCRPLRRCAHHPSLLIRI
jgi:hypothetical protein